MHSLPTHFAHTQSMVRATMHTIRTCAPLIFNLFRVEIVETAVPAAMMASEPYSKPAKPTYARLIGLWFSSCCVPMQTNKLKRITALAAMLGMRRNWNGAPFFFSSHNILCIRCARCDSIVTLVVVLAMVRFSGPNREISNSANQLANCDGRKKKETN